MIPKTRSELFKNKTNMKVPGKRDRNVGMWKDLVGLVDEIICNFRILGLVL